MKTVYVIISVCFFSCGFFQLHAQCNMDRHSTDWKDSWISDTPRPNVNPLRPDGHFIMYDFGFVYQLGNMHIWNSNVPDSTDRGIQDFSIDYSVDGSNWTALGDFTLSEGTGSAFYEGEDVVDFNGADARFVLISASTNYGGSTYSLSEVRFDLAGIVVPVDLLSFTVECSESGDTEISWETGEELSNDHFEIEASANGQTWVKICSVQPNASHRYTYSYSTHDKKYYRLVQVDRNGKRTTYMTRKADCHEGSHLINIFPNPARDYLDVSVKSENNELVNIVIFNSVGQQMEQLTLSTNVVHQLDITPFPSGGYILVVENGVQTIEKNFVIVD